MSPLAGAARREPQAARSAAERGHGLTINASIMLEQAPIRATGESVPSRHHGPQDALTPVPPIAGSTTARPGVRQSGCRDVLDSDPVLPGGSRAGPPCPPSPIVLRQGSLPVGAETWFRGSGRRSRVEPGWPRSGRAAHRAATPEPHYLLPPSIGDLVGRAAVEWQSPPRVQRRELLALCSRCRHPDRECGVIVVDGCRRQACEAMSAHG